MKASLSLAVSIFFFATHLNVDARGVKKITIETVGQSDLKEDPPAGGCKKFVPNETQIRNYFLKAYPVPSFIGAHDRYSPCFAKGFIEFDDNTRGNWKISSGGAATLVWDTGDVVTLLYKYNTWLDPFAGMYGLCDEGDC